MTSPAVILRELHRLRSHVRDLQDESQRLPRKLKAQQDKLARQEELLKEAQDHIKKLKVKIHDKETSLKTAHQQVAKHTKQLNESAGKKEYDALKSEIAHERDNAQKLEDEILETMSDVELRTAELPAKEQTIKTAKEEIGRFNQEVEKRQAELAALLRQALAELQEAEGAISVEMRPTYDRLVAARGEDAMSAVINCTCIACHTEITAQMYNDLLSGRLVPCNACGRLLYLPE